MKKIVDNILSLAFAGYMILLIYFLFFSEEYGRTLHYADYQYNLKLFHEISRYWTYREVVGMPNFLINIVGNVVIFLPFGFFVPSLKRRWKFFRVTGIGFLFSLSVETVQLITKVGSFDVDDLLLNTIGIALGYGNYYLCKKEIKKRRKIRRKAG